MPTAELPSYGVLPVRIREDLVLDGGTWQPAADTDRTRACRTVGNR